MSVRKYRSVEEMNLEQRWLPSGDPSIPEKIRYLWRLSEVLLQPVGTCIPRGVHKYRCIEDANADRARWEKQRVELLRRERERRQMG
jgi:hypothetical protein